MTQDPSMTTIIQLTKENFGQYRKAITKSEEESYPPNIQTSEEYYEILLSNPMPMAAVLLTEGSYAGNYVAHDLTTQEADEYRIPYEEGDRIAYLFNLLVVPEHQGKGYAKLLFDHVLARARAEGFTLFTGHFRDNASFALAKKHGMTPIKKEDDWQETGETYYLCTLRLDDV